MTLNTQSIASIIRQIAAVAAVVLAAIPKDGTAGISKWVLGLGGALLLTVEHYVSDPSTGSAPLQSANGTASTTGTPTSTTTPT